VAGAHQGGLAIAWRGGGAWRRHSLVAAGRWSLAATFVGGGGKAVVDVDEGDPCSSWKEKEV
jgi:hypothetical protein